MSIPTASAKRPWYRLHAVSWVLMLLTFAGLVYQNARLADDGLYGWFSGSTRQYRGWPCWYYEIKRDFGRVPSAPMRGPPVPTVTETIRPGAFAADVAIGLALCGLAGLLTEVFYRRVVLRYLAWRKRWLAARPDDAGDGESENATWDEAKNC